MRGGIRETVRTALSQSADPWVPGVAEPVTAHAWQRLARHGFVMANYGTQRWLEQDPAGELWGLAMIDLGDSLKCRMEALSASSRARYERFGLIFPESIPPESHIEAVQSALSFIALVPSLYATVAAYLRSLHVLQSPGLNFDVSHSDPEVPFSIFVSIPFSGREGSLRLAESIIHECMHLQLTLIEALLPLVYQGTASAFSPWQQRLRPLRGILHGVYVFSVIDAYYQTLNRGRGLAPEESAFVAKRRGDIVQEVARVAHVANAEGLTHEGRVLFGQLLQRFG